MDPVTTAVARTVTTESAAALKRESEGFLKAVLGEPAKALGGLLADKVNSRRHANLIKITVEAKRKLTDAGISPKEVPLKIIHPMLEAASLEEAPDLQSTWANLLANAADPRQTNSVFPSFPTMLKELGHREVCFLNSFYDEISGSDLPHGTRLADREVSKERLLGVYSDAGLSRFPRLATTTMKDWKDNPKDITADLTEFETMVDLLRRNGIIHEAATPGQIDLSEFAKGVNLKNLPRTLKVTKSTRYHVTELGTLFITACRPPR